MECDGKITLTGKTEVRKTHFQLPMYPLLISYGPTLNRTPNLCDEHPATNYLNHGTSVFFFLLVFTFFLFSSSSAGIAVRGESSSSSLSPPPSSSLSSSFSSCSTSSPSPPPLLLILLLLLPFHLYP
jgi:hypothetical protein